MTVLKTTDIIMNAISSLRPRRRGRGHGYGWIPAYAGMTCRRARRRGAGVVLAVFVSTLALLGLALPRLMSAQMSSANYKIPFDDLSAGGDYGTSANYLLKDTIGETATPSGEGMTSANYAACAGFQCLQESTFLSYVLATSTSPCTSSTTSTPPYAAPLGTLTSSSVTTAANHICVSTTTNNPNGVTIYVHGDSTGLRSIGTPTDVITAVDATLTAGSQGFGVCSANAANGFTAQSPFNGACNTSTNHAIGGPTSTSRPIYAASGPVTGAYGDILVKASISATTPAHNDYLDNVTLTAVATY